MAEFTVIGEWMNECDQGGLVLFVDHQPEHGSSPLAVASCEWVKAGFEICDGELHAVSEHANSKWTDRQIGFFLHTPHLLCIWVLSCNGRTTHSGSGTSQAHHLLSAPLALRAAGGDSGRSQGVFPQGAKGEIYVGVYASRPTNTLSESFMVEFEDLDIL